MHFFFTFVFFYLDPKDQMNTISALKLTFLFRLQKRMRKYTQGGRESGCARERERKHAAGFISYFSSVWLPDICWPFQPSQRHPPYTSLHHPLLLSPAFSSSGFIRLYSLRFPLVEIRVEHKTAWTREKGRKQKEKRKGEDGTGREREKTEIIKAVWGP